MSEENVKPEGEQPGGEGGTPPETPPTPPETPPEGGEKPGGEQPPEGTPPEGEKKETTPPADEEPPVRKKPIDYIRERQERRAEKAKAKEEGEDDDITPEDEELVSKVIDKKYGGTFEALQEKEFQAELGTFVQTNPEFEPYKAKIEKWAKHPAYSNLPLEQVAHAACGKELLKLGADKARAADSEADGSKTGGNTDRAPDGSAKKKVWDMTPEEFAAEEARVRRGA